MKKLPGIATAVVLALMSSGLCKPTRNWTGEDWRNWSWFRPIDAEPTARARLVRFEFPYSSLGRTQPQLDDLRIVDEQGYPTAFVLRSRSGGITLKWRSTRITEVGFVPGKYTQLEIDTGSADEPHNSVEVVNSESDFYAVVEVAVSDDQKEWRVVREKAPLYRFKSDGVRGSQTVSYPETRSRWLRLRISGPPTQFPVIECRASFTVETVAELRDIGTEPVAGPQEDPGESRWDLEFPEPMPISGVRFSTPVDEFHRAVVIESGDSEATLESVQEGQIYRYQSDADSPSTRSRLSFQFPTKWARRWRFRVLNHGDRPLTSLDLHPLYVPKRLVFRQEPGRTYRLLYGNDRAAGSKYDLGIVTTGAELDNAALVPLGAERPNPDYVSPAPWTERNPVLLWAALILSVAVLLWLAARSLKTSQ